MIDRYGPLFMAPRDIADDDCGYVEVSQRLSQWWFRWRRAGGSYVGLHERGN